jgi:hypothetical protein
VAYRVINIFRDIEPEMFIQLYKLSERALAEVAKAEPDIQALIGERVEAGDIFLPMRSSRNALQGASLRPPRYPDTISPPPAGVRLRKDAR